MSEQSSYRTLVDGIRQQVNELSAEEVHELQNDGVSFTLIDVREYEEIERGMIPGAFYLSKGVIECKIEGRVPNKDEKIVLYCGGGSRSLIAAESLQRMGYTNVYSMAGGFRGWYEAGLPVEGEALDIVP